MSFSGPWPDGDFGVSCIPSLDNPLSSVLEEDGNSASGADCQY